jgi:hypothetical protein
MADLSEIQASQSVKLAGAGPSTGIETNWAAVDANGGLSVVGTGTAGTPTGGVITVQGVAGMVAVSVSLTATGPVAPGTAATNSLLIGGQFNTALPTLTNGQQAAVQVDSSGRLLVNIAAGSSTGQVADKTAFTYGTTLFSNSGGVFQDTSPSLTAGQQGIVRLTANRAFHVNLRDASGNEKLGSSTSANSIPVVLASDQTALSVYDIINSAGQYRAQSVTTTAAEALGAGTILANRLSLTVTQTNGTVYWGYSNAVTTSSGTPIAKNQTASWAIGPNVHVWLISAGTVDCRITEGS